MTASSTPLITVVVVVTADHAARVPEFARSLAAAQVEAIWVLDVGVRVEFAPGVGAVVADSLADALARARAPWLALRHPGTRLPRGHFEALAAKLHGGAGVVVSGARPAPAADGAMPAAAWAEAPPDWPACALRRDTLVAANLVPDTRLRAELAADVLLWRALLLPGQSLAWTGVGEPAAATAHTEPPVAAWRDKATYVQAVLHAFVEPLEQAAALHGAAPRWLQLAVLRHLAWYFTVDARERAPTVIVDEPMAAVFHDLVRRALRHVDMALLARLPRRIASPEVCHALWSYQSPQLHSPPVADPYDHDQGLMRLTYWHHGTPPAERFAADGEPIEPAFAKQRACNWFRRRLLRQRIAWLPVAGKSRLTVELNGSAVAVAIGPQPFGAASASSASAPLDLDRVRTQLLPGKANLQQPLPAGWAGWKVRLVKALARFPLVRRHYRDAWVFVDRDVDADDSAEHLYRWVRENHPEVNAWYLLHPESPAWPRLRGEGFRLLAPGVRRRLLALNCGRVVSSHVGLEFGLDPAFYGDVMRWRYCFLQHGVTMNDVSHWLNSPSFDVFATASPAEYDAIVGDDTPYTYTRREVHRTGFPRHDRLLRIALQGGHDERRQLLVMPTWRGSLVDERMAAGSPADRLSAVARSAFTRNWRAFLNSPELHACLLRNGWRMVFMPHTNALPYLECFAVPAGCEVLRMANGGVQNILASTGMFVTDYTSVAFDMAFLRRSIVYFQFDREDFYAGGHNWRPGHFDYDRDGFGPVAFNLTDAVNAAIELMERDGQPTDEYLTRMVAAMPDADELACRRAFASIAGANHAWRHRRVDPVSMGAAPTAIEQEGAV